MIRSMTGYGKAEVSSAGINGEITAGVEIKSVNHRYYEFSARAPRIYGYLEEKLRSYVKGSISRGKIDVYVYIRKTESAGCEIKLNKNLLAQYVSELRSAGDLGLTDDLSLSSVMRLPDIFESENIEDEREFIWSAVKQALNAALCPYSEMREREGELLSADISSRADTIKEYVGKIQEHAPVLNEEYRLRLETKLKELISQPGIDESRLITEAAVFADKTAVDEELVRLRSHLSQLKIMLGEKEPVGKKLDFLIQEMYREINTVGSKISDLTISKIVVDVKSEIEKIREQVQNIE